MSGEYTRDELFKIFGQMKAGGWYWVRFTDEKEWHWQPFMWSGGFEVAEDERIFFLLDGKIAEVLKIPDPNELLTTVDGGRIWINSPQHIKDVKL